MFLKKVTEVQRSTISRIHNLFVLNYTLGIRSNSSALIWHLACIIIVTGIRMPPGSFEAPPYRLQNPLFPSLWFYRLFRSCNLQHISFQLRCIICIWLPWLLLVNKGYSRRKGHTKLIVNHWEVAGNTLGVYRSMKRSTGLRMISAIILWILKWKSSPQNIVFTLHYPSSQKSTFHITTDGKSWFCTNITIKGI